MTTGAPSGEVAPVRRFEGATEQRVRTAILISGRGSNMSALIDAARAADYPAEIVGVLSNSADAAGLAFAEEQGIPTAIVSHRGKDRVLFELEVDAVLRGWRTDLVCLAGFMRVLTPDFVKRWNGRILNIHPSLLPAYRGLNTHERALADGVREHGCTVHYVTPGLDEGPPILQARVPVRPGDTAESLAARVLSEEHRLYPRALAMVASGDTRFDVENVGTHSTSSMTPFSDDDLSHLEAHGIPALPAGVSAYVDNEGARIWYAAYGAGPPVVLLHGGLGNAGNFGYQVPALIAAGYRVVVIDSRGQGRSTRDERAYTYELMASDTRAVLDVLGIAKAAFVGWSDGAATSLVIAHDTPSRTAGVFFFACNVDETGTLPFAATPVIDRIYNHHVRDYAALSPVIGGFEKMRDDLNLMQAAQPDYGHDKLAEIGVPTWVVLGEHDEFISRDHARHMADAIPGASFHLLPGVSHFAPLQRPAAFNKAILDFLAAIGW